MFEVLYLVYADAAVVGDGVKRPRSASPLQANSGAAFGS